MNGYIRERLRADAAHLIARAAAERGIVHKGLRGRFRELLVDSILAPWLPPYAACATGVVVDVEDRVRESTQDDIVIFDRSIVPAVFAHSSAPEGVFPYDGVLGRVEVKSRLTRAELRNAAAAAREIVDMKFCSDQGPHLSWPRPVSTIFAFASDLSGPAEDELARMISVFQDLPPCGEIPGPIAALCVAGRGCWVYGGRGHNPAGNWLQARLVAPHDEILFFVGAISNSCYSIHSRRTGIDPEKGVGGGIGNFILTNDSYEAAVFRPSAAAISGESR
jgi:hypothetical protein